MSLVNLKEILSYADEKKIAVALFNIDSLEYAESVVSAAERAKLPVILGYPEGFFPFHDVEIVGPMLVNFANRASVPITVHIDHGNDPDKLMKAIHYGFSSIMYDGSKLPFEENVRICKELVHYAHNLGASVEGELGYIGFHSSEDDFTEGETSLDRFGSNRLTNPDQAHDFVDRTSVDALAVAIGNMHGYYRGIPKLDIERLREINMKTACPLVLHGGSGLSEADFLDAIQGGIRKINIHTASNDRSVNFAKAYVNNYTDWMQFTADMRDDHTILVQEFIELFGRKKDKIGER
jgi:fructose-bisphosphate aldolase class II